MRIFINPGHDIDYDSGAVNPINGLREADVALAVGELVKKYLEDIGFEVKLMQSDNLLHDSYHYDRRESVIDTANSYKADLFISIHCNAFNTMAKGTETLIHYMGGQSEKLADCIQNQIIDSLHTIDRGVKERPNLIVTKYTDMPAVLVELAFIDNADDVQLLMNNQDDFARAIARGVTDYLQ